MAAEFVNGWTDAPNAIATVVSTRVLTPRKAVILAAILNVAGAFSGTAVAATVGKGIVDAGVVNLTTVGAAMVGIVVWSTLAWRYGLPTSESHALISGLAGAGLAVGGVEVLLWSGWQKVLIGLAFSTFVGFAVGYLIIVAIYWACRRASPELVKKVFGKLQLISAGLMAFGHGSNDGQKFMGAFTLALVLSGVLPTFKVHPAVIFVCASVMGIGTYTGGWRIIKTMGMRMVRLEPHQGFAAETGAAAAILTASHFGIPLSTTHTINTAIMGVGAAKSLWAVKWTVARNVVAAWLLTFPLCGAIGWLVASLFKYLYP